MFPRRIAAAVLVVALALTALIAAPRPTIADTSPSAGGSVATGTASTSSGTSAGTAAGTGSTGEKVATKTVRVGWLLDNQGFQSGTPGSYMSGWGYEYLQTLSYYTPGWKYEYVTGTFTELMGKLERGEIDLMPNISYTTERAQKMLFSANPEGTEHYYIYAKPTRENLAKGDPKALDGLTIGCNSGVMQTQVGQKWLADEGVSCNYRYYDTGDELFAALSNNEVDAIIMNDTLSSKDAMAMFDVGSSDYYFVTPLDRQDLMDDINAAMTALRSTNPRYNDEVKTRYSVGDSGSASLTAQEQSWLRAHHNAITVGYLDKRLPYTDEGADGQMEGAFAALVDVLRGRFGITVDTKAFSSNEEMKRALDAGTVDAIMPIAKDYWLAEQSDLIQSNTLTSTSLTAIYSGDSLNDALKHIVCSTGSLFSEKITKVRYPKSKVTECRDSAASIKAVKDAKAACVVIPVSLVDTWRELYGFDGLKTAELPQQIELTCLMRKGDAELLSIINKGIVNAEDRIDSGSYSSDSYSTEESDVAKFVLRHKTAVIVGAISILLVAIAVLAWALYRARRDRQRAIVANSAKSAFLSRMSHDIRTPLNGIIGLLEIDDLHPDDMELARENRAKARVAADHLLTLISDILEMGKIEDRKVVLERKPFDLVELCRDVFVICDVQADEAGIAFKTDHGENLRYPHVVGSPSHVRRVLLNIIDNCIKYNKPGGAITCTSTMLGVEDDTVTYRMVIADTGIGMSPEFLKHIYEPFAQEDEDARSEFRGTGMGMPIVHELVELMGGHIEIESELGQGSTFTLTLPFIIDRHPKDHADDKRPDDASIAGMRIMLVEDNKLNREIAQTLLESAGAIVEPADDGQAAVDLFERRPAGSFDAILMDVMMPGMDGYEAARRIRTSGRPDAQAITIIAMTANAFAEDIEHARRAGMNDHLAKPVELAEIKTALARHRG